MASPRFAALLLLGLLACGGDDDGGGGGDDDGGGGDDGGGDPGESTCTGAVSGEVAGGFSGCRTAINHYPDGYTGLEQPHWIYTLVASSEAQSELEAPLESLGINLYIAGDPIEAAYGVADAHSFTSAFVYAPFPTAFEELTDMSLSVEVLDEVSDSVDDGYRVVSYQLEGSFDMTLASEGGGSVTVSTTF